MSPRAPAVSSGPRRTVATRVLLGFTVVTLALAVFAVWSFFAQRQQTQEAALMRSGYLPLSLALRDLVAGQDTWNTQLNHVTAARNPADKRVWFQTALRAGRPKSYGAVRAAIHRAFLQHPSTSVRVRGRELLAETSRIERDAASDRARIEQLFQALDAGDEGRALTLRDRLVSDGVSIKRRLRRLELRVQRSVDELLDAARSRERTSLQLSVALAVFAILVGVLMALYARRILQPVGRVTARAQAVAGGDLSPRQPLATNDEIGELSATFERMVAAISRANEQLVASERLATIGKMAAHVTHEIRNPLSSIALNVELLEEDLALAGTDEESRALLRAIKKEVDRLEALSTQYLSVARQEPTAVEEEDIGDLVREACDFVRRDLERHGIELAVEVDDPVPTALVDEGQLKQALLNLLRNAREVLDDGGHIRVEVHRDDDGVAISVADDGPGVPASIREHLFEPFFTTKAKGTGLGLAITRQIVEVHGGSIDCDVSGAGTRFLIRLPGRPRSRQPSRPIVAIS